eukprot:Colp12_sorted_trinity150504_noHs@20507
MIYHGQLLDDNSSLAQLNMTHGAVIHCVVGQAGTQAQQTQATSTLSSTVAQPGRYLKHLAIGAVGLGWYLVMSEGSQLFDTRTTVMLMFITGVLVFFLM